MGESESKILSQKEESEKPKIGTNVDVWDAEKSKYLGIGKYIGREKIEGTGLTTPKIKMPNGKILYGYQIWWHERVNPKTT